MTCIRLRKGEGKEGRRTGEGRKGGERGWRKNRAVLLCQKIWNGKVELTGLHSRGQVGTRQGTRETIQVTRYYSALDWNQKAKSEVSKWWTKSRIQAVECAHTSSQATRHVFGEKTADKQGWVKKIRVSRNTCFFTRLGDSRST